MRRILLAVYMDGGKDATASSGNQARAPHTIGALDAIILNRRDALLSLSLSPPLSLRLLHPLCLTLSLSLYFLLIRSDADDDVNFH